MILNYSVPAFTSTTQTVTTTAGQEYVLEYFYYHDAYINPDVTWNGILLTTPSSTFVSTTNPTFTEVSFTVLGTGSDILQFTDPRTGIAEIDDVSLVAVPELDSRGATVPLALSLGALLLLSDRRRRMAFGA